MCDEINYFETDNVKKLWALRVESYLSSEYFGRIVVDGTDVYPNTQPMEVLSDIGYHIHTASVDRTSV